MGAVWQSKKSFRIFGFSDFAYCPTPSHGYGKAVVLAAIAADAASWAGRTFQTHNNGRSEMMRAIQLAVAGVAVLVATAGQLQAGLITNGDFETGDFTGWNVSQAGDSSVFVAANPGDATLGPSPTSDFYAFAGNQEGPSQNIFTQTFAVPAGLTGLVFSFDYAYDTSAGFVNPNPDTLSLTVPANQQFRVEILAGTAAFDTVNPADIVFTAIQTAPGSTNPQPWTSFSQDIFGSVAPFQGQNLQVRFAEVDNLGPFDIGFDNVSLSADIAAVPEPSSLALFGMGACVAGIGAAGRRRREKHQEATA